MKDVAARMYPRTTAGHWAVVAIERVGAEASATATRMPRTTADAGSLVQDAVPAMVGARAGRADAVARDLELLLLAGAALLIGAAVGVRRRGGLR
ncbi:hypothetical protein [Streptomyces sp. NBC_01006]|uniref:hypothetical protein n=1 Tax=Streptomyces sp. NBC_01006 TaxID=2903716 RepID=UPI00386ED8A5|nr:hypothetical protein OG509_01340 [Streptomyces sp. NBC_01006]